MVAPPMAEPKGAKKDDDREKKVSLKVSEQSGELVSKLARMRGKSIQ